MRSVSDKSFRENENTIHFQKIFSEIRAVNEKMYKNMVQQDRPQTTMECDREKIRYACWTTKATEAHSEYVILNVLRDNND